MAALRIGEGGDSLSSGSLGRIGPLPLCMSCPLGSGHARERIVGAPSLLVNLSL